MERKIAVLSNINMDYVIRMLGKDFTIMASEGYGNELGQMLDKNSAYHVFSPEVTFLIIDLFELLEHDLTDAKGKIIEWFGILRECLEEGKEYFVSDTYLWGPELAILEDDCEKRKLEDKWQGMLEELCSDFPNVYRLPYRQLIERLGEENSFSTKTWYLGKILHTGVAQKRLIELIKREVYLSAGRTYPVEDYPKKVLLLDLDNTLWGGLAGEAEHTPILLSEEHEGLAYKNLQRLIAVMQQQGVLLGIVSKNNEEDALEILGKHPHCVLRPGYFAVRRINWQEKYKNIEDIARELNLGLDSIVFWDDDPAERELVKHMLPQVTVPDFPARPEELVTAMQDIYFRFFQKLTVTKEDLEKTEQYQANAKRNALQASMNYEEYLSKLQIVLTREEPKKNLQRLVQLVNKTNQFNLTTRRYDLTQMQRILEEKEKRVFLYRAEDSFGDNGIIAAVIVDVSGDPVIEEFVMSCRVMGRRIEDAIVEDVEKELQSEGFEKLIGYYLPTSKNKPVEKLYERLGYCLCERTKKEEKVYEICLANRPARVYYTKVK